MNKYKIVTFNGSYKEARIIEAGDPISAIQQTGTPANSVVLVKLLFDVDEE